MSKNSGENKKEDVLISEKGTHYCTCLDLPGGIYKKVIGNPEIPELEKIEIHEAPFRIIDELEVIRTMVEVYPPIGELLTESIKKMKETISTIEDETVKNDEKEEQDGKKEAKKDLEALRKQSKKLEKELESMDQSMKQKTFLQIKHHFTSDFYLSDYIKLMRNIPPKIKRLFDVLDKNSEKSIKTIICSFNEVNAEKYSFREFEFPQKILLPTQIEKKLGAAKITGFQLGFEESPLGINQIELEKNKEELRLKIKMKFEIEKPSEIFSPEMNRNIAECVNLLISDKGV